MLTISIKGIDNAGKTFSGEVFPEVLHLDTLSDEISFVKPIEYSLHVSEVSEGILVAGTISAKVEVSCGRCLEPFEFKLKLNDVCHFLENATTDILDVTEGLREDILISLPAKFVCDDECEGLCRACGANMNTEPCKCDLASLDSETESSPWDALDQINI